MLDVVLVAGLHIHTQHQSQVRQHVGVIAVRRPTGLVRIVAEFGTLLLAIQILCSGAANSGKSTSPTTEPKERPMHHATTLPVPEETCIRGDCATLFVSLELSRSTWVATALAL